MAERRTPLLRVRRRRTEYHAGLPWEARCNWVTCFGRTTYHDSQQEALADVLRHARTHWSVNPA